MLYRFSLLLFISFLFSNCHSSKQLIGLWEIEKVVVGKKEITPVARWTRLNKDYSQSSGNGWFQHSIGSWNIDPATKKLELINSNGITDTYGGFNWSIQGEEMIWKREEEGEIVEVFLKKTEKIPASPGNQLLGVWQPVNGDKNSYYFFRWDNRVVTQDKNKVKKYGSYRIHGHKNEIECIYYGDTLQTKRWSFSIKNEKMIELLPLGDENQSPMLFKRINYIPD